MLLPSPELAQLADQFDICLSGKTSPKGYDIRYRQMYWLMVFNKSGELTSACRLSDQLSKHTKSGDSLPEAFATIAEQGLLAKPSLEQLERNYTKERGSEKAFTALQEKIKMIDGVAQMRVSQFLAEVAPKTSDPALSRVRSLLTQAHACSHQVINHGAFAELRDNLANFLRNNPDNDSREALADTLVDIGLKYSFNIRAKCEAYARDLNRLATPSGRELSKLLVEKCEEVIASEEKKLRDMKPKDYGWVRLQARAGNAKATIEGLDRGKTHGVMRPIHAEWRQEATQQTQLSGDNKAGN